MYEDTANSRIGISTTSPAYKLDVAGDINISSGSKILYNSTTLFQKDGTNNGIYLGTGNLSGSLTGDENTFIGDGVGVANTSGYKNTFIGYLSGHDNTEGYRNVFIGPNSGANNTTGDANFFLGNSSGIANIEGNNNVFIGDYAGYWSTVSNNTFIGRSAGYQTKTGDKSTFIGAYSGEKNKWGKENVYIGYEAGYYDTLADYNTYVGNLAGRGASTATDAENNSFFGYKAGYGITTGDQNVFLGLQSGNTNTTGSYNTAVGYQAGYTNSTGIKNVFLGYQAGYNETGSEKLYIDNSNTSTPLIYGDFNKDSLVVNGDLHLKERFIDASGDAGTSGQILSSTATGTNWIAQSSLNDGDWTISGNNEYSTVSGKVNVGSSSFTEDAKFKVETTSNNYAGYFEVTRDDSTVYAVYGVADDGCYNVGVYGYAIGSDDATCNDFMGTGVENTGVVGVAENGETNFGGYFRSSGDDDSTLVNYGIYAMAYNAPYNYGIYSNTLGYHISDNSYAGYFKGGVYIEDSTGIGTSNPEYILDVVNGSNNSYSDSKYVARFFHEGDDSLKYGIIIQGGADNGSGTTYYLRANDGDGDAVGYLVNNNGTFGTYDPSDERTKRDIGDTKLKGLDIIKKLRVVDYKRLSKNNNAVHHGFVAQEVQQVFPYMVAKGSDGLLAVSKEQLVPVLVKAMQEQSGVIEQVKAETKEQKSEIETQNAKIQTLENELALLRTEMQELRNCVDCNSANTNGLRNNTDGAKLFQNNPNPFTKQTEIGYYLPESTINANLLVFDMTGKQMKSYTLASTGNGKLIINGGELEAGMYLYSLVADGKEIDTKRMILTNN